MYLLILLIIFSLIGFVRYRALYNPITIFNGIWLLVFGLYFSGITNFVSDLSARGYIAFLLMIIGFNGAFLYFAVIFHAIRKNIKLKKTVRKPSENFIKALFRVWLVLIIFEVIYSDGFPVLWYFMGVAKSYAQFGIPTLHGFVNSLSWVIMLFAFYLYLDVSTQKHTKKTMMRIMLTIISIYVLLLARQALVTSFIQMLTVYLLTKNVKYTKVLWTILLAIILFGIAGNFRSGADHFRSVAGLSTGGVDFLLGFYWVLMYVITPIGNMDSLVNQNISLNYGELSLAQILPSVVGDVLDISKGTFIDYFVNPAFNTSTFLQVPYRDFGLIGILGASAVYGMMAYIFWRGYRISNKNSESVFLYAIAVQIILMSFFVNMLLMLPILIQFIYIKVFFRFSSFIKIEAVKPVIENKSFADKISSE